MRVLRQGTTLLTPGNLNCTTFQSDEELCETEMLHKAFGSFSCSMQTFWLTLTFSLLLDAATTSVFSSLSYMNRPRQS